MAKYVGSWSIRDTIGGRRLEAEGFASTLGGLSEFDWTQNHGESDVKESDFVTTANTTQRSDQVDAMQMSSHGWPDGFLVWGGSVDTSEAVDFGKNDLEFFATHACDLLEHTSSNSVGRWIPPFQRRHYMLGFHNSSYSGGQNSRGTWFAMYSAWLYYWSGSWLFRVDIPVREAWAEANEIVEGSNVQWAYLRAETPDAPTYNERLRVAESNDPRTSAHRSRREDEPSLRPRRGRARPSARAHVPRQPRHRDGRRGGDPVTRRGVLRAARPELVRHGIREGEGRMTITAATFGLLALPADVLQTFAAPALMVEGEISGVEVDKDETVTVRFGQYLPLAHPKALAEAGYGGGHLEPGVVVRGRTRGQ